MLLLVPLLVPQAYISRARVDSFSLTADLMYVSSNAPRIARALFEICLRRGWSSAAELCLTMSKVGAVWRRKGGSVWLMLQRTGGHVRLFSQPATLMMLFSARSLPSQPSLLPPTRPLSYACGPTSTLCASSSSNCRSSCCASWRTAT